MSGVPVYTESPITAAKASGTTPQTTAPTTYGTPIAPAANPASTTTATPTPITTDPTSSSSYSAARPGAPAVPAPTPAAQRYTPAPQLRPTPTTSVAQEGPPLPQPGAVPQPPSSHLKSTLPPPPKAGESYRPPAQQTAQPQYYPPQMGIPAPVSAVRAQPAAGTTSATARSASVSYPVAVPQDAGTTSATARSASVSYPAAFPQDAGPRRILEHPPGYVQNPYASTFTSDQRRAHEAQDSVQWAWGGFGSEDSSSGTLFGADAEGIWNTAKSWATTAGRKLSQAETEVWKTLGGKE